MRKISVTGKESNTKPHSSGQSNKTNVYKKNETRSVERVEREVAAKMISSGNNPPPRD